MAIAKSSMFSPVNWSAAPHLKSSTASFPLRSKSHTELSSQQQ
uniref:Uncharacterized protein n=1 Tax=Arundo donax TaxID=35708 RepID=A0A0A8Y3Z0_ARUDO